MDVDEERGKMQFSEKLLLRLGDSRTSSGERLCSGQGCVSSQPAEAHALHDEPRGYVPVKLVLS